MGFRRTPFCLTALILRRRTRKLLALAKNRVRRHSYCGAGCKENVLQDLHRFREN